MSIPSHQAEEIATRVAVSIFAAQGLTARRDPAEIETDWQTWLTAIFPHLSTNLAMHHEELWDWIWNIQPRAYSPPFVGIWSRGHAKSTIAEMACLALGATRKRQYGWYVSGTQKQADDHVKNVAHKMVSDGIERYYPDLAKRQLNKFGHSEGWRRNRINTAHGFVIDALGLDVAARGGKLDDTRPDFFVIDDIDHSEDSADATAKKIRTLTESIIPAGAPYAIALAVQNLIHRNSVFAQLADGRADFLANRTVSGPHPALRNFQAERREEGTGYVISAGEPSWKFMSVEKCQATLDNIGLAAFRRECQHDVRQAQPGQIFKEFDPVYHVITWSEFARFYGQVARDEKGRPRIPERWNLGRGQDWGTTIQHPCATIYGARPFEGHALTDCRFVYREIVRPVWPTSRDEAGEPVTPQRIARLMNESEAAWREKGRFEISVMSHEANTARLTYQHDLPLSEQLVFSACHAGRTNGVATLQNYMQIDMAQPHPFRIDPRSGQSLMGRTRFYLIVADEQGELRVDNDGNLHVAEAIDEAGCIRLRAEIVEYHLPVTAGGDERALPHALFNDCIDGLRYLADAWFPSIAPLTQKERVLQALPANLKPEVIAALPEDKITSALCAQMAEFKKIEQQLQQQTYSSGFMAVRDKMRKRR